MASFTFLNLTYRTMFNFVLLGSAPLSTRTFIIIFIIVVCQAGEKQTIVAIKSICVYFV